MRHRTATITCPDGGIGRRVGLKHQCRKACRFDPGSGYEFDSTVIAKPLLIKDLAIFLFSRFRTFPHICEFSQKELTVLPTRNSIEKEHLMAQGCALKLH